MKLSVVIPCFNEEKHIEKCILSLLDNGFAQEKMEVLVVDGMSKDKTRILVGQLNKKYAQVRLIDNPKQKTPFALNLGIQNAGGDYIMIASAHSSFDKGYIQTMFDEMQRLNADVVGGVMETKIKNNTSTSAAIQSVLSHKFGVGNATFRIGTDDAIETDTVPFGLYRADLLKSIKGYDERLIRNHDIEMSKRILANGGKIFLTPKAKCYYYARETWTKLAKNNFDNGKWNLITAYYTRNFASLSLRHFIPLFFVTSLIIPTLLSLIFWPFILLSVLSFGLYFLTLVFIISKMDRGETSFFHLLWTFIVLHVSYGIGSFLGLFHMAKLFRN
jgi:glycosyltransferase involved in cell wall biosynthesis